MFLFHSFPDNPSHFTCILPTVKHWAYRIATSHSLSYVLVAPHPSVWAVEFLCRYASLCVYSCEVGPSGFNTLLWSSFSYLTWNNLVLLTNSLSVLFLSLFLLFALYSHAFWLASRCWLVLRIAACHLLYDRHFCDAEQMWQALSSMHIKSENESDTSEVHPFVIQQGKSSHYCVKM